MRLARQFNSVSADYARSLERLATGKRINRASDDPSGTQAVDPMKGRIAQINAEVKRIDLQDATFGARDGALSVLSDQLIELKGLVTTAANRSGLSKREREGLQNQAGDLLKSIDFLANTTRFRGEQIISGFNTKGLGLEALLDTANLNTGDVEAADKAVQNAIENVSGSRAAVGNAAKSNDTDRRTLLGELESLTGIVSSIEDTDYAKETSEAVRTKLLRDVTSFLSTLASSSTSDTILSLIKGATAISNR